MGIAVAAARQGVTKEAATLTRSLDLMMTDSASDRAFCEAYLWTLMGKTPSARACLQRTEGERIVPLRQAIEVQERLMRGAARVIR